MMEKGDICFQGNGQEQVLAALRNSNEDVIIYGAGVYACVLYRYLTSRGVAVHAFAVDREYYASDSLMGRNNMPIEEIADRAFAFKVVIGISNYPAAAAKLESLGIKAPYVVDVPDFLNIPESFLDEKFVEEKWDLLQAAFGNLEDKLSRDTYVAALNTKLNEDLSFIKPLVRPDHLYFPTTEFPVSDDERLLDVGGYTGDTVREFVATTKGLFERIISLEPYPEIYKKLVATINELGISDRCDAVNVGAWRNKATLSFARSDMDIDSKIATKGDETIHVDTIDNILDGLEQPVSFIKMDINGAEFEALLGARNTIKNSRPRIAVKMHVKEDFYRIPNLLKEYAPDIKLYLRQRNFMSMMLVLYGVFD